MLGQRFDRLRLDNALRLWRGDYPTVAAPRILNKAPARIDPLQFITLHFAKERADRLGRIGKAGIVFIHFNLGDDGNRLLLAALGKAVIQRLLDQVADAALGIGDAVSQRRQRQTFSFMGYLRAA